MWNNKHLHLWILFDCELDSVWQSQENILRIVVWKNDTFCKQAFHSLWHEEKNYQESQP